VTTKVNAARADLLASPVMQNMSVKRVLEFKEDLDDALTVSWLAFKNIDLKSMLTTTPQFKLI